MRRELYLREHLLLSLFGVVACSEDMDGQNAGKSAIIATSEPRDTELTGQSDDLPPPPGGPAYLDDSQGAAAARDVMVRYVKLLETAQLTDARRYWTMGSDPGILEAQLEQFERFDLTIGDPGPMEGAAGSVYINIPLRLDGRATDGSALALGGAATLRRANNVPGSSDVQRQWHIYRVDLQPWP